jgi:hypothetical protein
MHFRGRLAARSKPGTPQQFNRPDLVAAFILPFGTAASPSEKERRNEGWAFARWDRIYQGPAWRIIQEQFARGGVRLAKVLNEELR